MNENHGGSSGDDLREPDEIAAAENEGMGEAPGSPHVNPYIERVAVLEQERDTLKDQLLRALAETDNVRKRANRQIADERLYSVEKFARDLLNISDNLSRALDSVPEAERALLPDAVRSLLDGVQLTQKEFVAVLARHGVTAIDAAPGAAFDPALHQAVTQIPSPHPTGSVAECFQTGWRIGERTLRAAMVAVSAGGAAH